MDELPKAPSSAAKARAWAMYILSAALVATMVQLSIELPPLGGLLSGAGILWVIQRRRTRRDIQRLAMTGDVQAILAAWEPDFTAQDSPRTLGPLFRATTLAAYGLTDRARQVLSVAQRGPAWDDALEHRLFLEILLNSIDGDRQQAVAAAAAMSQLPLPASRWQRSRTITLRNAAAALARAFADQSEKRDARWLRGASRQNPLIQWPLFLAEVKVRLDLGQIRRAQAMLQRIPSWPRESLFSDFSEDLRKRAA